jgi:hypothetical protein
MEDPEGYERGKSGLPWNGPANPSEDYTRGKGIREGWAGVFSGFSKTQPTSTLGIPSSPASYNGPYGGSISGKGCAVVGGGLLAIPLLIFSYMGIAGWIGQSIESRRKEAGVQRLSQQERGNAYAAGTAKIDDAGVLLALQKDSWQSVKGYEDCRRKGRVYPVLLEPGEADTVNAGYVLYVCSYADGNGDPEDRNVAIEVNRPKAAPGTPPCASGRLDNCDMEKYRAWDAAVVTAPVPFMTAPSSWSEHVFEVKQHVVRDKQFMTHIEYTKMDVTVPAGAIVYLKQTYTTAPESDWAQVQFSWGNKGADVGRAINQEKFASYAGYVRKKALRMTGQGYMPNANEAIRPIYTPSAKGNPNPPRR